MKQTEKNDDDVIELGEDGSFDISTPPKIKKIQQTLPTPPSSTSNSKINNIPSEEILNLVPEGEYKIFTTSLSKEIFLIIHLKSNEKPQKVYLKDDDDNNLIIEINEDYNLAIDLSNLHIDKTAIHSTLWQNYLTFRFFKQNP